MRYVVVNLDCPWNPAVLEQRIARVHRLGQTKLVNVANFISKGTIEEKILDLLKYKKSIFSGVLDHGEDQVLLDDSRLKQVMDSIDDVIEKIPEKFTEPVNAESSVLEQAEETVNSSVNNELSSTNDLNKEERVIQTNKSDAEVTQSHATANNTLSALIQTGISLLQNLQKEMNAKTIENKVRSFIEKDSSTGKPFLKIPVPDEKILTQAASMFEQFFKLLK